MAEELRDRARAPGEIVEKRDDGTWLRNDGAELRPAAGNPFYVLATAHGEQGEKEDRDLAARNRRIWNGWACAGMSAEARAEIAKGLDLPEGDLAPLDAGERALLEGAFRERLGEGVAFPPPGEVDLDHTYFVQRLFMAKYVFAKRAQFFRAHFAGDAEFGSAHFDGNAGFGSAHFAAHAGFELAHFAGGASFYSAHFRGGDASFASAHFAGGASFASAHFAEEAWFGRAHFARDASFVSARLAGDARFDSAHFAENAWFQSAHFAGTAMFASAHFAGAAWFSDGAFEARTDFGGARFLGGVPRFFQRRFHDDTTFTPDRQHWPKVKAGRAAVDRDAYRRLRQVAAAQHNARTEHFFLRQELACDAVLAEDWLGRQIVRGYGFFSDYGYSVGRPLGGLAATVVVGGLVFLGAFVWEATLHGGTRSGGQAFGLSFSNTFGFLGFSRIYFPPEFFPGLPVWAKVLGGAQTILGIVFLFFLGLGLRNRFRLK